MNTQPYAIQVCFGLIISVYSLQVLSLYELLRFPPIVEPTIAEKNQNIGLVRADRAKEVPRILLKNRFMKFVNKPNPEDKNTLHSTIVYCTIESLSSVFSFG